MLTEQQILDTLDHCQYDYCDLVQLGHGYYYLIDSRLNVFRGKSDRWGIVVERLAYNPRAGFVVLDLNYHGNCLVNLPEQNGKLSNYQTIFPVDKTSFESTVEDETLLPNAQSWLVRSTEVALSHDEADYSAAGIELGEPGEICVDEAARLLITEHAHLFRATDPELYQCLPLDLDKILVLDEWHHRDFFLLQHSELSDWQIRQSYDLLKQAPHALAGMDFDAFAAHLRNSFQLNDEQDKTEWENNRPSAYETWRLLAKVIATGDASHYKPVVPPNTYWKNWPDSGGL